MVAFCILVWQLADLQAKKSRAGPGLQGFSLSSLNKARGVGQGRLGVLHVAERFANDLLGDACAFAALGGDAGRFANLTIAAAALVDGIANLAVGDTLAKTDVHRALPVEFVDGSDANQNENNCQRSFVGWPMTGTRTMCRRRDCHALRGPASVGVSWLRVGRGRKLPAFLNLPVARA